MAKRRIVAGLSLRKNVQICYSRHHFTLRTFCMFAENPQSCKTSRLYLACKFTSEIQVPAMLAYSL
jgi:hypothetical protein